MSQSFKDTPSSEKIRLSRPKLLDRDEALRSCFAGAAFPAADTPEVGDPAPADGQWCWRTDEEKLYQRRDGAWVEIDPGLIPALFKLTGSISPTALSANANDYAPTGLATASVLRLSSDASRTITGLSGGADGRMIIVHNVGSNPIVLADESSSSTAANRFALNGDLNLPGDGNAILRYDGTSSRWRVLGADISAVYVSGPTKSGFERTDANTAKVFVNNKEALRFYDAGSAFRFGTPNGINTAFPEFEFYADLTHRKFFTSSIFLADPGDTPEFALQAVGGAYGSATAVGFAYHLGGFLYCLHYDGTATTPQGPLTAPVDGDVAGQYPNLGRSASLAFPNYQIPSQTERGGGFLIETTPLNTITLVQRVAVPPEGGVVSFFRSTYEDTGVSYPWQLSNKDHWNRSAPGSRNYSNTPSRGNFTAVITSRANGAILAARAYADQTDGVDLSYDTANDSLCVDRVDNGTRVRCIEVLRANGVVDIGFATDGATRVLRVDPTDSSVLHRMVDAGATVGPSHTLLRDSASPAAADDLGEYVFSGRDSAANIEIYARFRARLQDPTSGAESGQYDFQTVQAGSLSGRMRIGAGVFHTSATGGDKGNNTLNFGAVYDDNTLLSCYVFDAAIDGAIDEAKWDALVPNAKIEGKPKHRVRRMRKAKTSERYVEVIDGAAIERFRELEIDVPDDIAIPVIDADGNPVMEEIEPSCYVPAFDENDAPIMEEFLEQATAADGSPIFEMFDTGEVDAKGKKVIGNKAKLRTAKRQAQRLKPPVLRQKVHLEPQYDWVDGEPETVVERKHDMMRKFKSRLGTDTDPLDIDAWVRHFREKRHLTSMPNEAKFDIEKGLPAGAWIQRLIETVEIQAVHIGTLNDRLKAAGF